MGLVFQVVDPGLNQGGVSSGDTHGQHLVGKDFGGDGLSFSSGAVDLTVVYEELLPGT